MTHDRVTAAAATSERRADVQVLRAIAICAVIWDHAAVPGPFFAAGFRGVDIFFVVSGFVITLSVTRRSRGSSIMPVGDFFARRIQRLYPAFVVVVLMTMGALALTRWIPEMEVRSAEAGLAGTWFGQNLWLLNQQISYFSPAFPNPFTHLWSLGVEEQFYLAAGLGLLLLSILPRPARSIVWLPVGLAALASYTACLYFGNPDWLPDDGIDRDFWPFYLPHLRAWQILMGVLVAIATTRSTRKTRAIQRGFARLVWLVAAVGIGLAVSVREPTSEGINSADYRIRTLATIACTATAALLLVGPHCAWRPHPIVTRLCDRVGRVGDRSYALYLVHWPVVLLQGQLRPMLPAAWLLNLAVTALLAEALHVVVERRVLRLSIAPRRVLALFFAGQSLLTGTIWWYRSIALDRAAHQPSQEVFFNETADCGQLVMPFRCAVRRSEMAIFVEGDSHSQMVFPELLEIAARRNLSVEANMQMGGYDFEYFSTDVLTTAAQVVVVIWFHHAQDPSNIEGRVLRHLDRSNVVRILVVLDTPSMTSWHLAKIPRPAAEAQRSPLLVERMTELARRDDRVRLIEPLDAFCEGDQCPVRDGDDIFYSDEHHLSWAGAARIADWLDRQIVAAFE